MNHDPASRLGRRYAVTSTEGKGLGMLQLTRRAEYESERVALYRGDCLEVMAGLGENSVDTIITDPPYGLSFMGKDWDHGVPGEHFWREALRVAKPGAMLMAFGGTRTFHRLICAIEDAGWEIRDCLMWVYGSGFPKSLDISKAIDKAAGAEREVVGVVHKSVAGMETGGRGNWSDDGFQWKAEVPVTAPATESAATWNGWGTALKPAWEPIVLAMKPLDGTFAENAVKWGVAGLWIDGGRWGNGLDRTGGGDCKKKGNIYTGAMDGRWKRPISPRPDGARWPANLIHDGSEEVLAGFPDRDGGGSIVAGGDFGYGGGMLTIAKPAMGDSGSAARFFYCAKASPSERNEGLKTAADRILARSCQAAAEAKRGNTVDSAGGAFNKARVVKNNHPTVKPQALMRYLCRLTRMPAGGTVLDPFMGSGSTGVAAIGEARTFIGIEKEETSFEIAEKRLRNAEQEAERDLFRAEMEQGVLF